jgi:hypothetical protein
MSARLNSLWRVSAESKESFKVTVLIRRLCESELLPEASGILDAYIYLFQYPETQLEELPQELYEFVAGWAKRYLKSDNPKLVPFILSAELTTETGTEEVPAELIQDVLSTETGTEEGFWYRSDNRFGRDEGDPLASKRPGIRVDRKGYSAALNRHREAGDISINGNSARDHADAWIKVRHKLVKSLAQLVKDTPARPYTKPDGVEDVYGGVYGGRYEHMRKNLKAIDKAIEDIV